MSDLLARVQGDLNTSRKAQDKSATLLLSTVLADIKNRAIELKQDLTDDDVVDVLRKGIKKRRESVDIYAANKRDDLAAKERAEQPSLQHPLHRLRHRGVK